ncbi:DUF3152 domain-containing protein [Streptomyces sp. cmx-4-9]|uniref:DUF3152 domain-containing protein n=1 Tax=Streptomyces sp. cmx-4-9 TaxID=2790941 RepID=UPI00397FC101
MPAGHTSARSRVSARTARRAERRRRLRRTVLGATALVAASAAVYVLAPSREGAALADGRPAAAQEPQDTADAPDGGADPAAQGGQRPTGPTRAATAAPSASPAAPARPTAPGPASSAPPAPVPSTSAAPGTFTSSAASGQPQGRGTALRWRLETEAGSGVEPDAAARAVEEILGDPRGWTRDPAYGFQLVGAGSPVDFTVKIATPATTDRLCEVVTPELVGETNCRAGHTVVVNLKRWQEGSPQFSGTVEEYRALIVNHEVGHELGREHETCPGPGRPAPAMMQQIKGLLGCTSNAWPFDGAGTYLSGPRVP